MKTILSLRKAGFTLIETTVVVTLLGMFAVFAVPRFTASLERGRAAEAFTYLSQVESAQGRYHKQNHRFSATLEDLDVRISHPGNFRVADFTSLDWSSSWQLRLTRRGQNSGHGEYTIVFDQEGFNGIKSSITGDLQP